MPPTYKLIAVPLDSAEAEASPDSFEVKIVSNLEFPPGTATGAMVAAAVAAHPLLGRPPGATIRAVAVEYSAWERAGHVIDVVTATPLTLTYVGRKPRTSIRDTLARYLVRSTDTEVSPVVHDDRFDDLLPDIFVDIAQAHDDLWLARADFQSRAATTLGFSRSLSLENFSVEYFSYEKARWLNAYVQASLVEAIFGNADRMRDLAAGGNAFEALSRLRSAVGKVERRLNPTPTPPDRLGSRHSVR